MNEHDRTSIAMSVAIGAFVGGVAGYLLFTNQGRSALRKLRPALDEMQQELGALAQSLQGAGGTAINGWRLFEDFINDVAAEQPRGRPSVMTH